MSERRYLSQPLGQHPEFIAAGDKIKFTDDKTPYTVQAVSARYAVCTRPFNPQRTVIYTAVDWQEDIRGTENLIFGLGAETQQQCWEMLVRLIDGKSEVSHRNRVPLNVEWHKHDTSRWKQKKRKETA